MVAQELKSAGFKVYAAARRVDRIADLEKDGITPVALDLTRDGSIARLIRRVTPAMWEQHYEKIVNISSMGGKIWTKFGGWYHATKYAVEGLSDCLRMELQPFGIDVVVVEPGGIKTDRGLIAAENLKKTSTCSPSQR